MIADQFVHSSSPPHTWVIFCNLTLEQGETALGSDTTSLPGCHCPIVARFAALMGTVTERQSLLGKTE